MRRISDEKAYFNCNRNYRDAGYPEFCAESYGAAGSKSQQIEIKAEVIHDMISVSLMPHPYD